MFPIFIISDGTGRTAEQFIQAAITQFENVEVRLNIRHSIRTEKQVRKVFEEVIAANGFVIHTVVSTRLRDFILELGRLNEIETIDLMGPLLAQLSNQFVFQPAEKPGLFHDLNKSYFQRIEALEFTMRHDDGQKVGELHNAEIVLLGVSRTFKTPLSIYLAFKGWLVANIPIILSLEPPDEMFQLEPERVFGLTTNPHQLAELRKVRDKHLGGATGNYANIKHVQEELLYAEMLYRKQPQWTIIDVTNKPIEEIASEILQQLRRRIRTEKQSVG